MKHFFLRIFGLFALLAASFFPASAEVVRLTSGIEYEIPVRRSLDLKLEAFLRDFDNTACRMFHLSRSDDTIELRLVFDDKIEADRGEYRRDGDCRILVMSNLFEEWGKDEELRLELFNAMLLSRHGIDPAQSGVRVPNWILSGIDAELEARLGPDRIYRVGYFPGVRQALLRGAQPDWFIRFTEDPPMADAEGPLRTLYRESSRLMLEMGQRLSGGTAGNALSDYLILSVRKPAERKLVFMSTLGRAAAARAGDPTLDDEAAARRGMDAWVKERVFSSFQPLPGQAVAAGFAALRPLHLTVAGPGDTTEELNGDLADLAAWSAQHAECAATAASLARALKRLRDVAGLQTTAEFAQLDRLLTQMASGVTVNDAEWRRAVEALPAACERQRRTEELLRRCELENPEWDDSVRSVTSAARTAEKPELSPGIQGFLDQVEKNYLHAE